MMPVMSVISVIRSLFGLDFYGDMLLREMLIGPVVRRMEIQLLPIREGTVKIFIPRTDYCCMCAVSYGTYLKYSSN